MNCCNGYGDCNQGRDCPARVTKVKQRYPKVQSADLTHPWRVQLRHLAKWVTLALTGWLFWCLVFLFVIK